jgi:uncharacterized protein YecE (DUF72 family)
LYVGVAGWSVSRAEAAEFPAGGSHLQRYSTRFNAAEINSSFHRPHRPSTYARWAAEVPPAFRFSAKVPKLITHVNKLRDADALLEVFADEVSNLGEKLACLLVQLPPSLAFDDDVARAFFTAMRARFAMNIVCEPRHETWFAPEADALLVAMRIGRVAADPARVPLARVPGGWNGIAYFRLHGSPRMYYSEYDVSYIAALAAELSKCVAAGVETWCIFDNTASGAAIRNALQLSRADQRLVL